MKRLFFSVLALTIGAFTFIACDKDKDDDNPQKGRDSYLSIDAQQDLFSEAFIKAGEQAHEFETLAESVRNLVDNFAGRRLVVDSAYSQMKADSVASRKMKAINEMNISNYGFDELYFGVDLILNETIVEGDTIMLAKVQQINHNVDRFIINIISNGHTLNASLKVSAAQSGAVEVQTPGDDKVEINTVKLPSVVSVAVKMDGNLMIGADLNISTDYLFKITEGLNAAETKVESVTFDGSNLNMSGVLSIGDCSFGAKLSYTDTAGLSIGTYTKVNGSEIIGADINIKAVLANNRNYANPANLMLLAMTGINGLNANARLGGDAIVFKAEVSKNPVTVIMPVISASEKEMPALIDSLNDAFKCSVYFKGFKEPQAKFLFAYQPVPENELINTDSGSDLDKMVAAIVNSGLSVVVETFDAEGKVITVPALEYFGKIDVQQFAQVMTEKFNAAFAETLAPLFGVGVDDFDLTELLKMIIFN